MKGNCILLRDDGNYEVFVHIQDGTENCGVFSTENEAREVWASSQEALNGRRRDPQDVGLVTFKNVVERKLVCLKPERGS
jgi:cold shock CspA family protein